MSLYRSWYQFLVDQGEAEGKKQQEVMQHLANAMCSIATKYPSRYAVPPYARGYAQAICAKTPTPYDKEIPPPIEGGQCCDAVYRVFMQVTQTFSNNPPQTRTFTFLNVQGAVTGYGISERPGETTGIQYYYIKIVDCNGVETRQWRAMGGAGYSGAINSVQPTRDDGLPDDCGNLGDEPDEDPPIDPVDFDFFVNVNDYDTDGNIINNNDYNLNIPTTINSPFNFSGSLGGINFNVDLGGVSIDPQPPSDVTKDDLKDIVRQPTFTPDEVEELDDNPEETEEEEDTVEETLEFVIVQVIKTPHKGKTITQKVEQDNDFFAGMFHWTVNTGGQIAYGEGIPIRKRYNVFPKPDGFTGYRTYTRNGATIQVRKFVQIVSQE